MDKNHADIATEIALNSESKAPDWIELFPKGPNIVGRDGRRWTLGDPRALATAFNSAAQPAPLDFEHATEIKGVKGERADAAGWVEELEVRGGSVWGRVEWTNDGAEAVESRKYRYVSPVFTYTKERRVMHFKNAGLTNQPNLQLAALNRQTNEGTSDMALPKSITDALELNEDASEASVLTAINKLKSDHKTALNRAEAGPDPEKYVPKADFEVAMNRVKEFEKAEAETKEAEITEAVDALIASGDPQHTPAKREDYLAMCRAEGGRDRFKRLFKADLDKALNKTQTADKTVETATGKAGAHGLTDEELAVCRQMGTEPKDFAEAKKAENAAA